MSGPVVWNVRRYCASAGLDTVARGPVDREAPGAALRLEWRWRISLAQLVGQPE